jgi:hypothetical protein
LAIQTLNPTQIGNITEAKLVARFIEMGYNVLQPVNHGLRYDFVIERDGHFQRVQAKTGRLMNEEYILFNASSVDPVSKAEVNYRGDIDLFAVYCPQNNTCYVIQVNAVATSKGILRITPTKNNQTKGIRWAADYEL